MTDDKKADPTWLKRLDAVRQAAEAQQHYKRRQGTSGPASKGRSVTAWRCGCGWTGTAKDLKPTGSGVACPACGETGGLAAGPG
jgi:hypothetical protein